MEAEVGSDDIEGGVNHHAWDNHTSFNKYPTHEPGYENKVRPHAARRMSESVLVYTIDAAMLTLFPSLLSVSS